MKIARKLILDHYDKLMTLYKLANPPLAEQARQDKEAWLKFVIEKFIVGGKI